MQNYMGQNQNQRIIAKDFYVYVEDFTALTAGTSQTGNINIQADSDFATQKLTFFADIAGAAQTADTLVMPLVTIQITDTGSGRNLMESPVAVPSLFGTGLLPFILPTEKIFPARSTITLTVSNFSAATDYNIRFDFIGYKIFKTGQ